MSLTISAPNTVIFDPDILLTIALADRPRLHKQLNVLLDRKVSDATELTYSLKVLLNKNSNLLGWQFDFRSCTIYIVVFSDNLG
ncbi:unnamed protein product [Leptosia nina]|uniref:Uncharacterized protein n=1 Tax=Leptosia nina TaxID=320188 RepID=A0AAV1IVT4_9NEOP